MFKLLAVGCLILGLAGCGVVPPHVQFAEYTAIGTAPSDDGGYPFRQRRSVIMLDTDNNKNLQATAAPYECKNDGEYSTVYRVWGVDNYIATTQLKVSYVDNTKFIDTLQVTTKDNIVDTISKIGAVVSAVVPLALQLVSAPAEKGAAKEWATFKKTMVDPTQKGIDKWTKDPLNEDYCVRLRDVVSESSLSLQDYVKNGLGQWQRTFPVPACATGVVEIVKASQCDKSDDSIKALASFRITFADADKVFPMSLPSSGSLKMNSVCGASVTEADKQDRSGLLDYLSGAVTQIQNVSAAWKKAQTGTATTEKPKTVK